MRRVTRNAQVYLEHASRIRENEFLALAKASRAFHKNWVEPPMTKAQYSVFMKRRRRKDSCCLFICRCEDGQLIGAVNISQIVRGYFQSAYLGYYVFKPFAKKKYMTEGLSLALELAFGELGLHRLEANLQAKNLPSRKLVKRLGFRKEGFSEKYLQVGGKWRDHERWAMTREGWKSIRP